MILSVRKYSWIGLTAIRSNLAYVGELLSRLIFMGVILYIFLQLWRVTYIETGSAQLGGLTLAQMLWYLAMTEAITTSNPRVADEVDLDVRTGALAIQLIRPLSYPLFRLWTAFGDRLVRFALNGTAGFITVLLLVGPIPITVESILYVVLTVPLAFVLDFMIFFLVGLAAFWLEDTSGLRLIVARAIMILGGMLIPLELFPEGVQSLLRALPFSSIVYGPARLLVRPDGAFFIDVVIRQGIAIAVFGILVALVYRVAVRRINANGG